MAGTYRFYGLLYLDAATSGGVNLASRSDAINTYVRCAATCHTSFDAHGEAFALITNDALQVRARLAALGCAAIEVVEIPFRSVVPREARFYAAHFKLDVLRAFATGALGARVGLVDIDCVLLRPIVLPDCLSVYDISDQVYPDYGVEPVRRDLARVAGMPIAAPLWFGGEFIAGPCERFRVLTEAIDDCLPRYVAGLGDLHHVGDEMVVSAAIHRVLRDGLEIDDIGRALQVVRWWSGRTHHRQMPFSAAKACAILHLPSDKAFLAAWGGRPADTPRFLRDYERMFRRKQWTLRLSHLRDRLLRRRARLVAEV